MRWVSWVRYISIVWFRYKTKWNHELDTIAGAVCELITTADIHCSILCRVFNKNKKVFIKTKNSNDIYAKHIQYAYSIKCVKSLCIHSYALRIYSFIRIYEWGLLVLWIINLIYYYWHPTISECSSMTLVFRSTCCKSGHSFAYWYLKKNLYMHYIYSIRRTPWF